MKTLSVVLRLGKGGRNHSRKYRIVVHSTEYYRKQRELKALRQRQKDMREGNIYAGEMKVALDLDNPKGPKVTTIIGDKVVVS